MHSRQFLYFIHLSFLLSTHAHTCTLTEQVSLLIIQVDHILPGDQAGLGGHGATSVWHHAQSRESAGELWLAISNVSHSSIIFFNANHNKCIWVDRTANELIWKALKCQILGAAVYVVVLVCWLESIIVSWLSDACHVLFLFLVMKWISVVYSPQCCL